MIKAINGIAHKGLNIIHHDQFATIPIFANFSPRKIKNNIVKNAPFILHLPYNRLLFHLLRARSTHRTGTRRTCLSNASARGLFLRRKTRSERYHRYNNHPSLDNQP